MFHVNFQWKKTFFLTESLRDTNWGDVGPQLINRLQAPLPPIFGDLCGECHLLEADESYLGKIEQLVVYVIYIYIWSKGGWYLYLSVGSSQFATEINHWGIQRAILGLCTVGGNKSYVHQVIWSCIPLSLFTGLYTSKRWSFGNLKKQTRLYMDVSKK